MKAALNSFMLHQVKIFVDRWQYMNAESRFPFMYSCLPSWEFIYFLIPTLRYSPGLRCKNRMSYITTFSKTEFFFQRGFEEVVGEIFPGYHSPSHKSKNIMVYLENNTRMLKKKWLHYIGELITQSEVLKNSWYIRRYHYGIHTFSLLASDMVSWQNFSHRPWDPPFKETLIFTKWRFMYGVQLGRHKSGGRCNDRKGGMYI